MMSPTKGAEVGHEASPARGAKVGHEASPARGAKVGEEVWPISSPIVFWDFETSGLDNERVSKTKFDPQAQNETSANNATINATNNASASSGKFGLAKVKSTLSALSMKALFALADLIIELDEFVARIAQRIFRALPLRVQKILQTVNEQFKIGRNRLLGIEVGQSPQRSSKQEERDSLDIRGGNLEMERGDVPGWVLVVLMTTGLVTALWTIAAPRLSSILKNSLDSMNNIR
jgi:hypothetical protein